mgnify:CR=1 FL=1
MDTNLIIGIVAAVVIVVLLIVWGVCLLYTSDAADD